MRMRYAVAGLLASSLLFGDDASWKNLSHVKKSLEYTVVLRSGTCLKGNIRSVAADSFLVVHVGQGSKSVNVSSVAVAPIRGYGPSVVECPNLRKRADN
jgi:hypothetical protein